MPQGLRVELDASTRRIADGRLIGGSPRRLLRLSAAGERALSELTGAPAISMPARVLARRLLAGGFAHPIPEPAPDSGAVTVVVPVRDRAAQLDRCLGALGGGVAVIVVDDGSEEPAALAALARSHAARLIRRPLSGGPAAARNAALPIVTTELVAFLDSDCVAPAGWLHALLGHFDDPLVAAVAPRVRPLTAQPAAAAAGASLTRRPARRWRPLGVLRRPAGEPCLASPLDMGERPARVIPGGWVSYVPSAALLVRRSTLAGGFDEDLRYGEDVDLVWRLCDAGHEVRYDPRVIVEHEEPPSARALLGRRFRYGTSAGPLARRHPSRLAPAIVHPAPALAALLALRGRRMTAAAVAAKHASTLLRDVTELAVPRPTAVGLLGESSLQAALSLARCTATVGLPVTAIVAWRQRRPVLLALPALVVLADERARGTPRVSTLRRAVLALADDGAYGAGVWWGCARARTARPLLPKLRHATRTGRQQ